MARYISADDRRHAARARHVTVLAGFPLRRISAVKTASLPLAESILQRQGIFRLYEKFRECLAMASAAELRPLCQRAIIPACAMSSRLHPQKPVRRARYLPYLVT